MAELWAAVAVVTEAEAKEVLAASNLLTRPDSCAGNFSTRSLFAHSQ
jgi:hypothetical protein